MASFPLLSSIGDPDGARTITSIIALLVAIGLALVLLAVWIFKTTRPDRELLAPLEVMGDRSWRRKDPVWQRRRLDEVRPAGATPLEPSIAPPEIDEAFEAGPTAPGFDDLRDGQPPDGELTDGELTDGRPASADPAADVPGRGSPEAGSTQQAVPGTDATPSGLVGPAPDVFLDDEFDPDALAAAREQLEQELADARRRDSGEQLDLFDDEHHR